MEIFKVESLFVYKCDLQYRVHKPWPVLNTLCIPSCVGMLQETSAPLLPTSPALATHSQEVGIGSRQSLMMHAQRKAYTPLIRIQRALILRSTAVISELGRYPSFKQIYNLNQLKCAGDTFSAALSDPHSPLVPSAA